VLGATPVVNPARRSVVIVGCLSAPLQFVGLHELAVARLLLDTCATVDEVKTALLTIKQHYRLAPLHYIVADRNGRSFVYENSTGRNVQHLIDGGGKIQVLTNFQLHKHRTSESMPSGR
jgi:penicillin V acylase-like amidase (Ntn superfamily)